MPGKVSVNMENKNESSSKMNFEEVLLGAEGRSDVNGSSQEMKYAATVLCGLGLEQHEVQLFTSRNLSLEKILKLTDEDLCYIGIQDVNKRKEIVRVLRTLQPKRTKELVMQETGTCDHFNNEVCQKILANTATHLNTLGKAMPYIQCRLKEIGLNQFLNHTISAHHTLVTVAEMGIQQADQVCQQLQDLHKEIEKLHSMGKKRTQKMRVCVILFGATTVFCAILCKLR